MQKPYGIHIDLLRLLSGDGKRCVAVIEAFIDESGTHKTSPVVCVAAYAGIHDEWIAFLREWGDREFHAKETVSKALKPLMFGAIDKSNIEGFSAWVSRSEYDQYATNHFKTGIGNTYSACAFMCAMGVCRWARDNNHGRVSFVIADGQPNAEHVEKQLKHMMRRDEVGIASVALSNYDDFAQLYTADFLAHSRTSDPEWYRKLYDTGRVSDGELKAEKIQKISNDMTNGIAAMRRNRRARCR